MIYLICCARDCDHDGVIHLTHGDGGGNDGEYEGWSFCSLAHLAATLRDDEHRSNMENDFPEGT